MSLKSFSLKLSKDDTKKEILKCGKDPSYFIENYCYILHPMKGLIRFSLYDFQKQIVNDFHDYRFNVVLKARQLGVSTVIAGFALWTMLFHRGKSVVVVATKESKAVNVVRKSKMMYKKIPKWLKVSDLVTDNQNSFELENGSWMKGVATSEDVGRSEALSLLIVDEAAIIKQLEHLWPGLYSTLSTGGKCIMASTPYGAYGHFYKTFIDAEVQKNDFHPSTYPWDVHPERDQAWFDKETRNMTKLAIAQEMLCSFNMSGQTVFDSEYIDKMEKTQICDPLYKTAFDRNLWVWEEFIPGQSYVIAADCSRGDADDFSVALVFRVEEKRLEIVAEYQGKATPDIFSNFLHTLGIQYGTCLLVVENNTIGYAVLDKLINNRYPNVYYSEKSTHDYVESYQAENRSSVIPGFSTTSKTRPLVIAKMEEFLRNEILIYHSHRMLNECKTFVWNGARAEAQSGYHDDLVMACSIGCFVRDLVFEVNVVELEYKKAFLTSMFRSSTDFNTKISGQIGASKQIDLSDKIEEYKQYSWLYMDNNLRKK